MNKMQKSDIVAPGSFLILNKETQLILWNFF